MTATVRLQRFLASAGVSARRKAEELITAGRVSVNGAIVRTLGTKVDPEHDSVTVDGEAVAALDTFYVLFNKPKGCITAVTDDRGRPTVMDYLPNLPVPVKPVGRLDFYSEGVLLLTNDGELAARLLAPASHVPKTYHVKVHGQLTKEEVAHLRDGVRLDDGSVTLPAEIAVLPGESKHTWLGITIHEGKHRQIHRMLEAIGYQIDKLQRVAFANLSFHDLRIGDARELTQLELNALRDMVGLDHSAVARGTWHKQREMTDIPRRARMKARAEADELAAASAASASQRTPDTAAGDEDDAGYDDARESEAWSSAPPARSFGTQQHPRHGRDPGTPARGPGPRADAPRRGPAPRADAPRRGPAQRADAPRSGPAPRADAPRSGPASRAEAPRRGPPDASRRSGKPASGEAPRRTYQPRDRNAGPRHGADAGVRERPAADTASRGDAGRAAAGSRGPRGGSYSRGARSDSSGGGAARTETGPRGDSSYRSGGRAASGSSDRAGGRGPRRDPSTRGGAGRADAAPRGPRGDSSYRSGGRPGSGSYSGGAGGRGPRRDPSTGGAGPRGPRGDSSSSGGIDARNGASFGGAGRDASRSAFKPGETGSSPASNSTYRGDREGPPARPRPDAHPGTERFDPNPPRAAAPRERPRGGAKPAKRADKPRWRDTGGPPVRDGAPRGQGRSFGKRGKPQRGR